MNVAIAAVLFAGLAVTGGFEPVDAMGVIAGSFWQRLMVLNLVLVGFNLLPAFPMDGGRVLRAVLAMRLGRRRATAIAANVGQGLAILFGAIGFFYNPFLIFIGIFVFLGAQAEAGIVEMQSALAGLRVRDAMMTRFRTLAPHDTLGQAVTELLAGSQQDFPILKDNQPIGILRRNDLVKALSEGRRNAVVTEDMGSHCGTVDEDALLQGAVDSMRERQCTTMPVMSAGRMIGLLTFENISEMLMVHAAMDRHGGSQPPVIQPTPIALGSP